MITSITLSTFSFLITALIKSISSSSISFTIFSFWAWLASCKSFAGNDGFWYPKYSLNISLVYAFVDLGVWNIVRSGIGSGLSNTVALGLDYVLVQVLKLCLLLLLEIFCF